MPANATTSYVGVFVSPDRYRQFTVDSLEMDAVRSNLSKYSLNNSTVSRISLFSIDGYALVISVGAVCFVGGLIIGLRL